jgi:hypothetical protein
MTAKHAEGPFSVKAKHHCAKVANWSVAAIANFLAAGVDLEKI